MLLITLRICLKRLFMRNVCVHICRGEGGGGLTKGTCVRDTPQNILDSVDHLVHHNLPKLELLAMPMPMPTVIMRLFMRKVVERLKAA